MSQDFWESRYQAGDMPWEKGAPSPGLVDFLAAHPEVARGTVCVPGCGTGHDARAWARAGFPVFGYDIAPSAIHLATRQAQLDCATGVRPSPGAATSASSGNSRCSAVLGGSEPAAPGDGRTPAHFQVADFLQDTPPFLFDWVFEHTLFCAIQPQERDDYVRALLRWLKPDGQYLAVNYLIPDRDGPPFGTTRDELWQRFSSHFELLQEWVPRSYPNRTGLELMLWWRRKG
jgi:methyl halide transferase